MAALPDAVTLSRKLGANLVLLHVYTRFQLGRHPEGQGWMEQALELARREWPRVDGVLVEGAVSACILSLAKMREIGLIVMAVRPGDVEHGTRLQAIISDVIRDGTCPVLSLVSHNVELSPAHS